MSIHDRNIYIGQGVRVRGVFRDPATGQYVDPGTVSVVFQRPDGTEVGATVENTEEGHYSGRTVVDQSGKWHARMVSQAPGEAAREFEFTVERSRFVPG